ncbi:MAG: hypothetical protein GXY08_09635 [Ruminococcus sp.]|nr:hypothetical protein [Ruminococcus sp.]
MKKIALMTALLLALTSLAACGDTDGDDSSSKKSKKNSSDTTQGYELNDDEDETEETTEEDTEEVTDEPTTEEKTDEPTTAASGGNEDISFVRGRVEGHSYISDYGNFRFDADDSWTFATDEEILQMMGLASNYSDTKEELEKLIANQTVIYDSHALKNDGQKNIIFMFENVRKEGADPDDLTAESFLEILKMNLNSSQDAQYSGFTDIKSLNIGSDEYKYFTVNTQTVMNNNITQTYACKRVDDYYFGVIYTSTVDDFVEFSSNFRTAK